MDPKNLSSTCSLYFCCNVQVFRRIDINLRSKRISNFENDHRFEKIKSHLDKLKKGLSEDHIDTIAIAIKVHFYVSFLFDENRLF